MPAPAPYQQRPQYPQRPQPLQARYSPPAPFRPTPYPRVPQYPVAPPYPPAAHYAPLDPAGGQSHRSTVALLVGGGALVVVAAVVLGLGLAKLSSSNGDELDVRQAEAGIKQILTDSGYGYGIADVAAISCNSGANPRVQPGAGFTCDVVVDGATRRVAVVFVDDQGTYEVDRPR
jgi:hypothetical protein